MLSEKLDVLFSLRLMFI